MTIKDITKPLVIVVATTTLIGGLGSYIWNEEHRPPILEIFIFSLGSGRSIFVRTPDDKRILIDGGANSEIIRELTKILPFYSRRIDMIMATNTEGKNISGLIDIVERYNIGRAYLPAVTLESLSLASSSDQIYSTFIDTLNNRNVEIEKVLAGKIINLDSKTMMEITFPYEIPNPPSPKLVTSNNFIYSKASAPEILFNITLGNRRIAFLGNASNKIQKYVASSTIVSSSKSDVLIVSHSALAANIAPRLIEVLKPEYLVYSRNLGSGLPKSSNVKVSKNSNIKTKKKEIVDPLGYLATENKFNLKENGSVKIIIDNNENLSVGYIQ